MATGTGTGTGTGAGSKGKYETRTVALALQLAMGTSTTRPDAPGKGDEEEASSINHRLICWVARLLWACITGAAAEVTRLSAILERQYRYQLTVAFETLASGQGCEQRSCTHEKQHYQAASMLAYTANRFRLPVLLALAVDWLRASRTLDEMFTAPSPSPKGKLPAVLIPGFRAPRNKPKRDYVREAWMRVFRGELVPAHILADPLANVDEASLWFFAKLPVQVQDEIRQPAVTAPPLLFPITLQRRGDDFIGSLDWAVLSSQGAGDIMTTAGWVDGKEVFGFDGDQVPQLAGATVSLVGGQGQGSPVPIPPAPVPDPPPGEPSPEPGNRNPVMAHRLESLAAEITRDVAALTDRLVAIAAELRGRA